MQNKDKKLALFQQLSLETEPVSLLDLLGKLKSELSERTVRRWLADLLQEGLIKKIGQKKATKYQGGEMTTRFILC